MFNFALDIEILIGDMFEVEMKKRKKDYDTSEKLMNEMQASMENLIERVWRDYVSDGSLSD